MSGIDYKKFRKLLLKNEHYNSCVHCGSFFELPLLYVLSNLTDIDIMYSIRNVAAFQDGDTVEKFHCVTLLRIATNDCHIGFARLQKSKRKVTSETEFYKRPMQLNSKGPSMLRIMNIRREWNLFKRLFTNFDRKWLDLSEMKVDFVYAVRCPSWPAVADEWRTRRRENGWPPVDVIDKIIRSGCHLVSKPHQSNPNDDTQWRYSFSRAEVILIHNWTPVQKYIYHILRLIKSEVVKARGGENKTVLCTYFFKTLMLWACEEKPREFWREENIEEAVGKLLCTMIEWLIEKRCPNYFIPDNNMIDHLTSDDDLIEDIVMLSTFKDDGLTRLLEINSYMRGRPALHVAAPNKLLEIICLIVNRWCTEKTPEWTHLENCLHMSESITPQIRHLFQGIQIHRSLMTSKDKSFEQIQTALECFDLAKKADEEFSNVVVPLEFSVLEVIQHASEKLKLLMEHKWKRDDVVQGHSATEWALNAGVLGSGVDPPPILRGPKTYSPPKPHVNSSCCMAQTQNIEGARALPAPYGSTPLVLGDPGVDCPQKRFRYCCYSRETKPQSSFSGSRFFKDPMIHRRMTAAEAQLVKFQSLVQQLFADLTQGWNSSAFFITAAYRANFFYAAQGDFKAAIKECDDAWLYLDFLKKKTRQTDSMLIQNLFHVVLVNDWSIIFDDHLQMVLGFLTLSHALRCGGKTASSPGFSRIVVHVYSTEFLRYIRFQSVRCLNGSETVTYGCDFRDAARDVFYEYQNHRTVSRILLLTAFRVSGIKPRRIGQTRYEVRWPR